MLTEDFVAELARIGLGGLEVDHPDHQEDERAELRSIAGRLGLLATGSSDYHGTNKTTLLGARLTDPEAYERLLSRPTALSPVGD